MARSKMPRMETMIIAICFLGIALWAINKCSAKRSEMVSRIKDYPTETETTNDNSDNAELPKLQNPPEPQPQKEATPEPVKEEPARLPGRTPRTTEEAAPPTVATSEPEGPTLYVTMQGLNMRKEPGLKGAPVAKLKLYEPVTYLNQKTEWTQEINLGSEKVTDHWVKIKTQSGKVGWVFGPGVHFYKIDRAKPIE